MYVLAVQQYGSVYSLTLKAPPIICSRRQLKNFAAF